MMEMEKARSGEWLEWAEVEEMKAEGECAWRLASVTMGGGGCVEEDGGGRCFRRRGGGTGSRWLMKEDTAR